MKILILADNFPPETNAAASRVFERARMWVAWGHRVTVLTSFPNFPVGKRFPGYESGLFRREVMDGVHVVRLPTVMRPNAGVLPRAIDQGSYLPLAAPLATLVRGVDVVFASSPHIFAGLAGPFSTRLGRRPLVLGVAGLWPESILPVGAVKNRQLIGALEAAELWLYRRSHAIVALTGRFKDSMMRRGVPESKVHVIRNGADLRLFSPATPDPKTRTELGIPNDAFVLAYIGNYGPAQALGAALDAAELLRDRPRFRLLMVGGGAQESELRRRAERMENVVFQGRQPRENMPALWAASDAALVHLADRTTFASVLPSKILEAMAMAKPIVLSAPAGVASELVQEEGIGVCVGAEQPGALAESIRAVMDDATTLSTMQQRCIDAVPRYSREAQARAVLKVLELAAERR
ncbi:MAG: glycosyltransferase family 4 protein [Myxococcota bacterium]